MKVPPSRRSNAIGCVAWALFIAAFVLGLVSRWAGDPSWLRWGVGLPVSLAWLAAGAAWLSSRLSDRWDQEAAEERAARRESLRPR